jgi:hypothetical protein
VCAEKARLTNEVADAIKLIISFHLQELKHLLKGLCFAKTPFGEGRICGNNVTRSAKLVIHCGIYFWRSTARPQREKFLTAPFVRVKILPTCGCVISSASLSYCSA